MTTRNRTEADIADLEEKRAERQPSNAADRIAQIAERVPAAANAATATDLIYFDGCPAFAYGNGVGSLTLTAARQLVDTNGQLFEDHIVVGMLRAPMHILRHLRACIDEVEKIEAKYAAAAIAATERPSGMAH